MLICPSCGHENPDPNKFCGECATPLRAAAIGASAEERKVVTVLFCDLVGFTAASETADPEDVRARIRPYHHLLRSEIEGYGGTVEKFIGDAVMAVFGAPIAHEDDPERAVRAGLRILESIADLNAEDPALELKVRIGVETGEAVVALGANPERGEGIVTGDVVNTASRLQGAAPVDGVAVGTGTHAATKELFELEAMEPVTLKGKAEPVALWHAKQARSRFGTDLTRKPTTVLVGRELERALLTGTLERSIRDGTVHLMTIVGEPGVGKSRLVAELGTFIEDRPDLITWRQGRCLPYGDGITFWALGEIVKAEAGILESDAPDAAASKIDRIVPAEHADAPWLRQRLRPLVGLEAPPAAREENFAAWRTFLESMAERRPCVFVVEDLHWADQAMLEFIEHVIEYAEGIPMMLVGTARPELFEKAPGFAQAARNSNRVNLSPLSEIETARLVSELLQQAVLPAEVQSLIIDRSGGNPLYAEEFVRLLKDTGALRRDGPTWALDPNATVPVPSGVQGLIAARLDTVEADRKAMLYDASVIGKVFWAGALVEMGDRDPGAVADALHELSRKELVRPQRTSSMEGESEYAFWHTLVRDVCYAQIPRGSRADKHRAAAAWLERAAGERAEDLAEILAAHYLTALELAKVSGKTQDLDQLSASARRFLALAGDRALGLDSVGAEASYRRALELMPEGDPERPEIIVRLAEALMERARFAEAEACFAEASTGFLARGEVRAGALAMARRGLPLSRMGDPRNREIATEALELLEPLPPGPELVAVLAEEAGARLVIGELRRAVDTAERAISLAADLDLPEPARALGFRGSARASLGDAEGLTEMRRGIEVAESQGLGREGAVIRHNLANNLRPIEGPRSALNAWRETVAFSERRGIEEFALAGASGSLESLADLGWFDEALDLASTLAPRLEAAGDLATLLWIRSLTLSVHLERGELEGSSREVDWLEQSAREFADAQAFAFAFPPSARAAAEVGEPARALALLAELDRTANVRADGFYFSNLPGSVRTALALGDPGLAARLVSGLELVYPLTEFALASARALLAEHEGDRPAAAELFARAASGWEGFEMPVEHGYALLGRGRCLVVLGMLAEATPSLRRAREIFTPLGAKPALAQIDELLAQVTRLTS
jgi:class 3 adenylate cyclase/tetratricopeptide (TPR) repeat protein